MRTQHTNANRLTDASFDYRLVRRSLGEGGSPIALLALLAAGMMLAETAGGGIVVQVPTFDNLTNPESGNHNVNANDNGPYVWQNLTFTEGLNGILIVGFGWEGSLNLTSVDYGGTPMTAVTNRDGGEEEDHIYYLLDPASGEDLTITTSGGGLRCGAGMIYATGVSQTGPEATATATDGDVSLTASQGALVFDHAADDDGGEFSSGGLANNVYRFAGGSDFGASYVVVESAGEVTTDWPYTISDVLIAMASFAPAAEAPTGAPVIQNLPVTNVMTSSAWFNGLLVNTGSSACAVCVLWGETDASNTWNWANTNWFDGTSWATNTSFTTNITPLDSGSDYYYAYAATNATTNAIASPSKYFITGEVTVQATDTNAQYGGGAGNGEYTLYRPDTCTGAALTVYFTTNGSTASGYTLSATGSVTIDAGSTSTVVTLTPSVSSVGDAILTLTTATTNAYPIGAMNSATVTVLESAIPEEIFVAPVGSGASHTSPYRDWATAATNIADAITFANANAPTLKYVTVSNGTYDITAELAITTNLTVRSFGNGVTGGLDNARLTIVQRESGTTRIFNISNSGTLLDGLTIQNGYQSSGGGIYIPANISPTVSNCIIRANTATGRGGGGIYWAGNNSSLIVNCEITDNIHSGGPDDDGGAASYNENGYPTFRNCLIARNRASNGGCAGLYNRGAGGFTVENCTIVSNTTTSGSSFGAIRKRDGGGVYMRNTIVRYNYDAGGEYNIQHLGGTADYTYTCTKSPVVGGTGNTQLDPQFVDLEASNYTLKAWSPCVDTGNNTPVTWATDLAGNPRITNAVGTAQTVDMGAYEYQPGALEAGFAADRTEIFAGSEVVFTAIVGGTNKNALAYYWTFGDGNTQSGSDKAVVTNTYASSGRYTVSLAVTNAALEGSGATRTDYIDAFGPIVYVATNSPSPAVPYTNWATAALTIGDAINALNGDVVGDAGLPGIVVLVSNGTYNISSPIVIQEPIVVRSFGNGVTGGLDNAANTVVKNSSTANNVYPIIRITHASAAVQGFTIRDGRYTGGADNQYGGGVSMSGGLVSECIVTNNGANSSNGGGGGGISMTGGTVSNCLVTANGWRAGNGNGIYMNSSDALVTHSRITDHKAASFGIGNNAIYGGGVYINNGTLRNCLVAGNEGRTFPANSSYGGGVYMNNGTVESCTIVTNSATATSGGGGVYRNGNGTVRNCIIYFNTEDGNLDNWRSSDADAQPNYTCTTPMPSYGANNEDGDPLFADLAGGDYTLDIGSPCIDTGTNQTWMVDAKDLADHDRKTYGGVAGSRSQPIVDMGAYELWQLASEGTLFVIR